MAQPIKITEVNRPLTCEEHDSNIDALLNRDNHTGQQNCNTIEPVSLNQCIGDSTVFTTLDGEVTAIDARLQNVESALSAGGSIESDLQSLRSELLNEIDLIEITLNNHDDRITILEQRADGFDSSILSINARIDFEVGQLQGQISGNDTDIALLQTSVGNLTTQVNNNISAIANETAARVNADLGIIADLNVEEANRIAGDNNLQTQITALAGTSASADNTLQNNINNEALLRQGADNQLRAEFEAGDLALQAQISSLQGQINGIVPTGMIVMWAGSSVPSGWLLCNGQTVSRTTYSNLFSVCGTQYGSTSSSNFRVPNFVSRFPRGTSASQGGAAGGSSSTTISGSQLPAHSHTVSVGSHSHSVNVAHQHQLTIFGHTHSGSGTGSHDHGLSQIGFTDFGGSVTKSSGSDDLTFSSRSSNFNRNTDVASVSVGGTASAEVRIYPFTSGSQGTGGILGDNGNNRTNGMEGGETKTTNSFNYGTRTTSTAGSSSSISILNPYLDMRFIIKT